MVSVLMESQTPQVSNNLLGQNYEIALNNLIQAVFDSLHEPDSKKLSSLSSDFDELLQCRVDPPFETIWVYPALVFRSFSSPENEPLKRVSAIKDLFQLIVSCSTSSNPIKSIALIAPVTYNVFRLAMGLKVFEQNGKKQKKFVREVKGLVDSILGYINVCCEDLDGNFDVSESLIRPVGELVGVWMWDNKVEGEECVRAFFPLLSDRIVERVGAEECELSALAGFVIAETFLLKLCLRFSEDASRKELQDELRAWIVASITGLRNPYFFETLLMMLLEPSLRTASLLNTDDERCLRKILYDAVVLVEYSFLKPERMNQLPAKHVKSILMARLLVTGEAIEFHRKHKDQMKAISYANAFTGSSLPSLITKWVRSEIGAEDKASEPSSSSPAALLRWILKLEISGIRIIDDDVSKTRAKLLLDSTTEGIEQPVSKDGRKKPDTDLLFFIDNKGEEEEEEEGDKLMNESTSAAFVAAAHAMQSAGPESKKRKGKDSEGKSSVKFLKHSLHENSSSRERSSSIADSDDSISESEVENPSTDEE